MIRGIKEETFKKVGAKLSGDRKKIFFPCYSAYRKQVGKVTYRPEERIKYDNTFEKNNNTIYNEWTLPSLFYGKPIVIVEGIFDALSLIQYNVPVLAALTNRLSVSKLNKIKRYTSTILLWFDSDPHGQGGANKTYELAEKNGMFVQNFSPNLAKDPNELLNKDKQHFEWITQELKEILECIG